MMSCVIVNFIIVALSKLFGGFVLNNYYFSLTQILLVIAKWESLLDCPFYVNILNNSSFLGGKGREHA
jgi:hypothetical protein